MVVLSIPVTLLANTETAPWAVRGLFEYHPTQSSEFRSGDYPGLRNCFFNMRFKPDQPPTYLMVPDSHLVDRLTPQTPNSTWSI